MSSSDLMRYDSRLVAMTPEALAASADEAIGEIVAAVRDGSNMAVAMRTSAPASATINR